MFGMGYQELLMVALIGILLFGSAQLPKLMRDMGRSINEFKAGMKDKPSTDRIDEPASDADIRDEVKA